jgi:hypothetical protein
MTQKQEYKAPEVKILGDVRTLTQKNVNGTKTDKAFPAGTPVSSLTFSA